MISFLSVPYGNPEAPCFRWISLIIVMSGVALVGYSGSLIKDAVKEAVVHHLARALNLQHDPKKKAIEEPEVTKVLVGMSQFTFVDCFYLYLSVPRDFLCIVRPNFVSSLCSLMPNTFSRFLHPSLALLPNLSLKVCLN
jgi:hypothetical protein